MKLLFLSVGSALAYSCTNKLPSLAKACAKDYKAHCSNVDKLSLVAVLKCGKTNEASLQPDCLAEIRKDFPATYACTDDLSTYCPDFGRLTPDQWGKNGKASGDNGKASHESDNDDDDDSSKKKKKKDRSQPPHPTTQNPPATLPAQPAQPPKDAGLVPDPNPNVVEEPAPEDSQDSSSESYTDYFTWDYYGGLDYTHTSGSASSASSANINSLHSQQQKDRSPKDNQQCFRKNYAAFSAPCLNAIAEQWAAEQTAKGVKNMSAPSADEAYDMMAPPVSYTTPEWKKMGRTLFYIALGFFVCTLVTCLCCCCRRCKKRRAARIVPSEGVQELASLPEAVVVPMAGPARYVPTAVAVRPQQTPAYIPYTGQGLTAYVPLAQPVHV